MRRSKGAQIEMCWEMAFLSSGDGYLWDLPGLHQGCPVPFRVSRGNVAFLSRHCSGTGPHLVLRGESRGFSRVAAGSLGFLSICDGDLWQCLLDLDSEIETHGPGQSLSWFSLGHTGLSVCILLSRSGDASGMRLASSQKWD